MTHEEKIHYMKIAAGIVGYGFSTEQLDTLVSIYEMVIEKKGETDLKNILTVQEGAKKRADIKHRSELLDKVSEKL